MCLLPFEFPYSRRECLYELKDVRTAREVPLFASRLARFQNAFARFFYDVGYRRWRPHTLFRVSRARLESSLDQGLFGLHGAPESCEINFLLALRACAVMSLTPSCICSWVVCGVVYIIISRCSSLAYLH